MFFEDLDKLRSNPLSEEYDETEILDFGHRIASGYVDAMEASPMATITLRSAPHWVDLKRFIQYYRDIRGGRISCVSPSTLLKFQNIELESLRAENARLREDRDRRAALRVVNGGGAPVTTIPDGPKLN